MRENAIRSDELRVESRRLYAVDQQKILSLHESFVEVNCPACDAGDKELFYERDRFIFNLCNACETVYVSPRPTRSMLFEHYRTSLSEKYWNEKIYPQSEPARIKHLILPRINKIIECCKKHQTPMNTLIDVGAGCGMLLEQVIKSGAFKNAFAIEPNPSSANSCRTRGLHVIEDFIENIATLSIDVATSIETIEHVYDPSEYVKSIYNILNTNGLFIIATPNIKGFDLLILKDKSDNTSAPDHLNYFHPRSIRILLERHGFEILEIDTPGKLDAELVRNKALAGEISFTNQPFLKRILIDEWETYMDSFQKWLSDNGLSSHMWIAAQKR